MTMLDRMRRHRNWLKWSLFLVVVAFIALYFPDFVGTTTGASNATEVARVGDERITAGTFRTAYQRQLQAYSQAYGDSVNPQLLRQLGIEQQILRQLIDERAALAEARRLGIQVSDAEVAQRIFAIPAFQDELGGIVCVFPNPSAWRTTGTTARSGPGRSAAAAIRW